MKMLLRLGVLFTSVAMLAFASTIFAQENDTPPPAADKPENAAAEDTGPESAQEVEINEDTYRQFMELKDANRQGDIIPETVYKPGSGLQKLDKLPEESQKHLRNELREIIVQGDPWQPGDENADYPYTPSEAASKNPALQKQEMEAWGELVDSYNQREAQIYADRSGNRATMSPADGKGSQPGSGAHREGKDGEDEEGVPGQPSEQEKNPDRDDTAGAFSPDTVHDPNAQSASGVSQNALEFLQGLGGNGEDATGGQAGTPQGGQQGSAGTPGQAQTGQDDTARQASNAAGEKQSPDTSTAGASSVAQADGQQSGQDSAQATAQNSGEGSARGQDQADGKEDREQGDGQAGSQEEGKTLAVEQTESEAKADSIPVPDDDFTFSTGEPEVESTVGTTQNALEFLKAESTQTGDVTDGAMETGPPPAGTLNIQDLFNAQGVGIGTATGQENATPDSDKPPDDTNTDKDNGGRS